jgi:hypothetical protein
LIWRTLVVLAFFPACALAQNFSGYQETTLDAVFQKWNEITKADGPGVSYRAELDKVRFIATLRSFPVPCSNAPLEIALRLTGSENFLQQASINHCFTFTSNAGRTIAAFVQDILVPGLKADAKLGSPVEIYAVVEAYVVQADRSRNYPIMMVTRFEPQ